MEIIKTKALSGESLISAIQGAYYEGERFILRVGEMEVALVPLEDAQELDMIEVENKR